MVTKWKRLQQKTVRLGDEKTEYLVGHVHATHRIFTAATTARLRRTVLSGRPVEVAAKFLDQAAAARAGVVDRQQHAESRPVIDDSQFVPAPPPAAR